MPPRRRKGGDGPPEQPSREDGAPLHEIAQTRYLNYALSVITARATQNLSRFDLDLSPEKPDAGMSD